MEDYYIWVIHNLQEQVKQQTELIKVLTQMKLDIKQKEG